MGASHLRRKLSKHAVPKRRTAPSVGAQIRDAGPPVRRFDSSLKNTVLSLPPRGSLTIEV